MNYLPDSYDLRAEAFSIFREKEAFQALKLFSEAQEFDQKLFDRAYRASLPMVGLNLKIHFNTLNYDDTDDLVSVGAIKLWHVISQKKYDVCATTMFYISKCVYNAMIGQVTLLKKEPKFNPAWKLPQPYNYAAATTLSTELRVFMRLLPETLLKTVAKSVRFGGLERLAILYMVRNLCYGGHISNFILKNKFKLRDDMLGWWLGYAGLLFRKAVFELKEDSNITEFLQDDSMLEEQLMYQNSSLLDPDTPPDNHDLYY